MDSASWPWWRRHGWTVVLLCTTAGIAFLVRTLWMIQLLQQYGPIDLFGGGSDSFYHFRVAKYIVLNHTNLIIDSGLKYPLGAINPREPLFDWMNGVLGILFAGAFGGDARQAAAFFLELDGPLWAALGVFPIYLIGKEISDRRVGIVAALIYGLTVAGMDSSNFGYANYLSFYTFFILLTVFGYLRTIHLAGTRRWVGSYRKPQEIPGAIRAFVRTERAAVKWAVFTGVSFGALALAWQGYSFVVATIVIFLIFALLVERIRRVDSFGLYVATWIVGLVGFPMAAPYYWVQGLALSWLGLPLLVFVGGLLICLPLIVLRDQPWVVSIPAFVAVGAATIGALYFVNQSDFFNIVTGQGYFVKTLVYSTVAEAQAPSIDQLILGYGVATFFIAFIGLAFWGYRMVRGRFPRVLMMAVVFAIISIYLPISAAKFFYLGSAAFALLPAEALIRALDIADLPKLRRTVSQLSDRRSQVAAFRRAFKARNVLVPVGIVLLLTVNAWYAVDAGIAYNYKGTYSQQIYNSLPSFLQTSPANASNFYLGAAGTQLDTPPQYDEAGYNWLAQQDPNIPLPHRPAFISWWDYGFQALAEGDHPSVADNFQNGISPAGNFLLAQNESLSIGILTTTLLVAEQRSSGQTNLPGGLNTVLAADGVDVARLHTELNNPSSDMALVLAHPERYLAVDPSHLDGQNALYDVVSWDLASTRTTNGMAQLYDDVQSYTHWTIRYAMVDNRLFPFSGQDTGIFYAPADLTDRVISGGGTPTTYFTVNITGTDGNTYAYGQLPSGVSAAGYPITYHPAFYNSMIYRIFIGYNGSQVGLSSSPSSQIPGVTLQNAQPMPGWMMSHFQLRYQTAYYCAFASPNGHPGCQRAMNLPEALKLAKATNGSVDHSESSYASGGGEMILAYYPGQPLVGTVQLPDGTPVPGVRVTVDDEFGIPHQATTSGPQGQYSLILPPGNDTINVTTGQVNLVTQEGTTHLLGIHMPVPDAFGYALQPTPIVRPIVLSPATVEGIVYWNNAGNATYQPRLDPPAAGATAELWGAGATRSTTVDVSGGYRFSDVPPGTYNLSVLYRGSNFTNGSSAIVFAQPGQTTNHSVALSPAHLRGRVARFDGGPADGATVQLADAYGVLRNTTTDPSGNYSFGGIPTGNLTVRAFLPSEGLATSVQALASVTAAANITQNLTLEPFASVHLTVLSNGNPIAGFAVRFLPVVPFPLPQAASAPAPNGTGVPPGASGNSSGNGTGVSANLGPIHANGTLFITGADGSLQGTLPIGNYSVYGLGLVGSTWSAGLATAEVTDGGNALAPLVVTPAARISGNTPTQNAGVGAKVQILAYDASGRVAWTFTNDSGNWGLSLPKATYTVLALQPPSAGYPTSLARIAVVHLSGDTTVPLALQTAVRFRPFVGSPAATVGAPTPVPGAHVEVTVPSEGIVLSASSNASGNVTFYVPATLGPGASYCANATAPGYAAFSECGLSPDALTTLATLSLVPNATTLAFSVSGAPGGSAITLNLTASSASARSVVLHGGPSFSTSVVPGSYRVSAWAPAPSGTVGLYQQTAPMNLSIPVGAASASGAIALVHVVLTNATLVLPPGVPAANATITLSSASYTARVTGTGWRSGFLLPPGSYSVLASALGPGSHAAVATIAFNATGVASAPLLLTSPGTTLALNLSAGGTTFPNTTLAGRLLSGSGWSVPIRFHDGRYIGIVAANVSYTASVNGTALVTGADGSPYYARLAAAPAAPPCTPSAPSASCPVPTTLVPIASGISGTISLVGFPGTVPAELSFVGPGGLLNTTTVNATTGQFGVTLAPGTYTLYARTSGSSALFANISEVTVGPNATTGTTIFLSPAWTDRITLIPPPGGANVTHGALYVVTSGDLSLALPPITPNVPTSLVLPIGTYTIRGSASGDPYGVPVNATATASVSLFSGNTATNLPLAWQFHRIVAFNLPVSSYALGHGGTVTVPFSVRNIGNVPFAVHFTGSPATFNFTFTPSNATLGLASANDSIAGSVQITIPFGTAVAHAPIQLEALVNGANGSVAGFAAPGLTVAITPFYGLVVGQSAVSTASAAPYNISVPFYVRNTGNVPESVALSVLDSVRLKGLGWSASFLQNGKPLTAASSIADGTNATFSLLLTAAPGRALPPGSAEVVATVANGTGGLRASQLLVIPTTTVSVVAPGLSVGGPGLGSPPPYPDWLVPVLVFVPAIAFLVIAFVYRWYRTRRWTRR